MREADVSGELCRWLHLQVQKHRVRVGVGCIGGGDGEDPIQNTLTTWSQLAFNLVSGALPSRPCFAQNTAMEDSF